MIDLTGTFVDQMDVDSAPLSSLRVLGPRTVSERENNGENGTFESLVILGNKDDKAQRTDLEGQRSKKSKLPSDSDWYSMYRCFKGRRETPEGLIAKCQQILIDAKCMGCLPCADSFFLG